MRNLVPKQLDKLYHKLLFLDDRKTFQSTEIMVMRKRQFTKLYACHWESFFCVLPQFMLKSYQFLTSKNSNS
jgi:hypothetical protein